MATSDWDAHTHHATYHRIIWSCFHYFLFFDFALNKKTSAIGRGSIWCILKNLKRNNRSLCGFIPHHTTYSTNCVFHFSFINIKTKLSLSFYQIQVFDFNQNHYPFSLIGQMYKLIFNWPNKNQIIFLNSIELVDITKLPPFEAKKSQIKIWNSIWFHTFAAEY